MVGKKIDWRKNWWSNWVRKSHAKSCRGTMIKRIVKTEYEKKLNSMKNEVNQQ